MTLVSTPSAYSVASLEKTEVVMKIPFFALLDGFFAALIAGPQVVMPSEYNREVFGGDDACEFASLDEAKEILGLLTRHWNNIAGTLLKGEGYLPILLKDSDGMAQPSNAQFGELKHIEWDGWGWAGQDTTVYLVFDPSDSLLTAARKHAHGKFEGIPCEVAGVSQLDSHWYAVQFYTNEFWGRRNELDCSGFTR
jgi:Uncharacterised protein family (UPF0149)